MRQTLAERYAAPVVRAHGDRVELLGGKPLALALERAHAAGYRDVTRRIVAIDLAGLPWFSVPADGLQLWRQHDDEGGELVTDVIAGDPGLQVVSELRGWQLVRLVDGATGWVAPLTGQLEPAPAAALRGEVANVEPDGFASVVEAFVGVPYRWGGTTRAGIDCSGLVQRAAWIAGSYWPSRHSTALLSEGARAPAASIRRGDVLVLRRSVATVGSITAQPLPPEAGPERHPMHVAVAIDSATAVHASRDAWKVACEPIASLRERYRLLSVRRLGSAD